MSTMIERVARAIYETEPYGISATREMPWTDVHESQKEGFRIKARAAIEAMREPTAKMKHVVSANWGRRTWAEYDEVITAALEETQ